MSDVTGGGEYFHDATALFVDHTADAVTRAVRRARELRRGAPWAPGDLDVLAPDLTWRHERDHSRVLRTQPLGLLLWRLGQCIAVDVLYVARKLAEAGVDPGADLFGAAHRHFLSLGRAGDYALCVLVELSTLRRFRTLLLDGRGATVGEFLRLAKLALASLSIRSECPLEAEWASALPSHAPLVPPGTFTLLELLECSARARELAFLELLLAPADVVDAWRETRLFGVYEAAFLPLMSALGGAKFLPMVVDLAVSGQLDLACGGSSEAPNVIIVEDVGEHQDPRKTEQPDRRSAIGLRVEGSSGFGGFLSVAS